MPIALTCSTCGRSYRLGADLAGRKVRCPGCASLQVVPGSADGEGLFSLDTDVGEPKGLHPAFDRDRFLFRQKLMSVSEKYVVWDDEERPVLYIVRPAHGWRQFVAILGTLGVFILTFATTMGVFLTLPGNRPVSGPLAAFFIFAFVLCFLLPVVAYVVLSPKRHIYFYPDESMDRLLLLVQQDQKFQMLVATYTVFDPDGRCLARIKKNYLYNFVRKRWDVWDAEGSRLVLIAREDSLLLSLLRRFLGPTMGLLRTNFILLVPRGGDDEIVRGEFNRNFTILDRYVLDLTRDRTRLIDRRLAVALGVLLDTGEHR